MTMHQPIKKSVSGQEPETHSEEKTAMSEERRSNDNQHYTRMGEKC